MTAKKEVSHKAELLEALKSAADELHEVNLANRNGNKMRNPEMAVAAELKARDAIAKAEVPAGAR